jgi:ABC-type cobalamin/Fe3+-siderophores transport system ATPase subunit
LIAIIGNKGSGKSALSDCIALALDTNAGKMGFLEKERFLKDPARTRTKITLQMCDGSNTTRQLSDLVKNDAKSRVRYLPQSFVEDLCGEIGSTQKLQALIDEILFQHLPPNLQTGANTLSEVIKKNSSAHGIRLEKLTSELHSINDKICGLESKLSSSEKQKLVTTEVDLRKDLDSLRKAQKPIMLKKPSTTAAANYDQLRQRAMSLAKNLENQVEQSEDFIAETTAAKNSILEIKEYLRTINEASIRMVGLNDSIPERYRLELAKVISIKTDEKHIDSALLSIDKDAKRAQFVKNIKNKAHRKIQVVLENAAGELSQIDRTYTESREARAAWHRKVSAIIGARNKPAAKTLKNIKVQLLDIAKILPGELSSLEKKRLELSKNIIKEKYDREKDLAGLYKPAEIYLDDVSKTLGLEASELLSIESDFRIDPDFNQRFCSFINKSRKGTFYQEKADHVLTQIRHEVTSNDQDTFVQFAQRLHYAINYDISDGGQDQATGIDTQLKDVGKKLEFYDYVFGLGYANASFTIKFGQRPLDVLSPGERGLLLLAFFFLLDKSSYPLIVDQPEENLDNETIYTRLVTFIRHARTRRQTILVTHNPNLAVACDADQIIVATINKEAGNKISYSSGALEENHINEACLRILEGTRPAFKKRGDTYQIQP